MFGLHAFVGCMYQYAPFLACTSGLQLDLPCNQDVNWVLNRCLTHHLLHHTTSRDLRVHHIPTYVCYRLGLQPQEPQQ